MASENPPNTALPAGVLVLYEESKGLRQPEVKLFSPDPNIQDEVNSWIHARPGLVVHRIDWLPSGGSMGASVLYSQGNRATEALRIPIPGAKRKAAPDEAIQRLGVLVILLGILFGVAGLVMYALFFPTTWYGEPGAIMDADLAVKLTTLAAGAGMVLGAGGVALIFRARLMAA